jgi:BirA family biotin operon repressor/biotin-[acetyl-CoA-carboxylase] ligase
MMREPQPIGSWPDLLEAATAQCAMLNTVVVLRETASTQDHARACPPGTVVIAWRQTAGRGRLGRTWADTGTDGLAISINVPPSAPDRLAGCAAVAACEAVEQAALEAGGGVPEVRIKWPNDLWIDGRKLGGILIEQDAVRATVGIGINVSQRSFPESISRTATSLAMRGFAVDRIALACHLVQRLDAWIAASPDLMVQEYVARDALAGTRCGLATPDGVIEGTVLRCDPMEGMRIRTSSGDRTLPAASTSVLASLDRSSS